MNQRLVAIGACATAGLLAPGLLALAQTDGDAQPNQSPPTALAITLGDDRQTLVNKQLSFELPAAVVPDNIIIQEVLWDFGDGVRTTGEKVTHLYQRAGTYTVQAVVRTDEVTLEDTIEVRVFDQLILLVTDSIVPTDELVLEQQQAAATGILLQVLRAKGTGPEVLTEEELTQQLLDARDDVARAKVILIETSGGIGANVLTRFAQHIRQTEELSLAELDMNEKGLIILTDTPLGVLAPTAQSVYDQLQPAYVLMTKPGAINLLLAPLTAEEAKDSILNSPFDHRLLGSFSARTLRDIGPTNFMSFAINYLVNRGVPINSITLILMLPVIATILSFSRQVIGIKAFGIITPAMTALSFLVLGLQYGLVVFLAVLLSGTFTRILMRRLHLLYLPRMALVLTTVSLAILLLLGVGTISNRTSALSFSIFPILILTLLAEEFIAVQFKAGARSALTITAWTLVLAIACYFIVSWQLLRTMIISYPEVVLLAIPLNIIIGRWSGLRLTEYIRFRELLRARP